MPSCTRPSSRSMPVRRANASPGGGRTEALVDAEAHAVGRGVGALGPLARAEREVAGREAAATAAGGHVRRPRSGRAGARGSWRARGGDPPTRRAGSRSRAPATPGDSARAASRARLAPAVVAVPTSAEAPCRRPATRPGAPTPRGRVADTNCDANRRAWLTWIATHRRRPDLSQVRRAPHRTRALTRSPPTPRPARPCCEAWAGRASATRSASRSLLHAGARRTAAHTRRVRHATRSRSASSRPSR